MHVTAIVAAAGSGARFGGAVPKQFLPLGGRPVVAHAMAALAASGRIEAFVLVVPAGAEERCRREVVEPFGLGGATEVVAGGAERQHSIANGLARAKATTDLILIHDGVRPFVSPEIVRATLEAAARWGAAIAAVRVTDTAKRVDAAGLVVGTPERPRLWAAQTPQAFRADVLRRAYRKAEADGVLATDDAVLVERLGEPVRVVEGSYANLKITTADDLALAEGILRARGAGPGAA